MKTRKSWQEKFEVAVKGLPKVVEVPPKWRKQMGGRRILVPTPNASDRRGIELQANPTRPASPITRNSSSHNPLK